MSNKSLCQTIASWFAPQEKPQPRFYVPVTQENRETFDWFPILEKAKLELSKEADAYLVKYNNTYEEEKKNFKIELSSYKNNTIKIIRNGQIDVIPIADIRKVSVSTGSAPKIVNGRFYVDKECNTSTYNFFETHSILSSNSYHDHTRLDAPEAIPSRTDVVNIFPVIEIYCPFGLGDSILEKIQELMAE